MTDAEMIAQLRVALKRANDSAELFERRWYLEKQRAEDLVVAEREACATICDEMAVTVGDGAVTALHLAAREIRNRPIDGEP